MIEKFSVHHLSSEVTKNLLPKVTREINPLDQRIGFLISTSAEMVRRLIRTGSFENGFDESGDSMLVLPTPGLIPRLKNIPLPEHAIRLLADPLRAREVAKQSALYYAHVHSFLDQLGLSLDDPDITDMALEFLNSPEDVRSGRDFDIYAVVRPELRTSIKRIASDAKDRNGFLMGIRADVPFELLDRGSSGTPEFSVFFGMYGVNHSKVAFIEPLGLHEEAYIESLR